MKDKTKQILKPGYKLTEIGEIPEEWEVVKLGNTIEKVRQVDPRKNLDTEFRYIDVSGVSNEFFKIIDSKGYTGKNAPHRARKPVREHDIIFATVRPYLKRAAIVPEDFSGQICSTAFTVVRCLQGIVDHKFVFYYLLTDRVIDLLTAIQRGSNYPAVSDNDLYNLKIPLPPLPEQRKIAEILSAVDKAIQKTNEIIQKTRELKKGLMQQLLTKGIGHIEFKQTEIGEIPADWKVARLGEVLEFIRNGLTYRQTKDGNGYPLTRIETISDGVIDKTRVGYLAELTEREIESYKLKLGDILLSHINSVEHIGKTAIYEGDPPLLIHGMNLLLLRVSEEKVLAFFLIQYFKWNVTRNRLRLMAKKAVNQASINQTELKSVLVPLPPLSEQQKIAEILSTVDERIEVARQKREKLEELKKGLMQVLLTGKVRVTGSLESVES